MTATIDYLKYEDMTKRQIAISIENAEKKIEKYYSKIKYESELIEFLKVKMNEALKQKKYNFVSLNKSGLRELYEKTKEDFTQQELQEIENQKNMEIREYDEK